MGSLRSRLTWSLVFGVLMLAAYYLAGLFGMPVGFLYRNAAGLGAARGVVDAAAMLAAAGLMVAAVVVAARAVLSPAPFVRRLVNAVPAVLLGAFLAGLLMAALAIGATGMVSAGPLSTSFTNAWIGVSGLLAGIALIVAGARVNLGAGALKIAALASGAASVAGAVAGVAMLVVLGILLTAQPATGGFGPGGFGPGGPEGNRGQPNAGGTPQAGQAPRAQGTPGANPQGQPGQQRGQQTPGAGGPGQGGFPQGGQPGQGGFPQGGQPGQGGFPPEGGRGPGGPGGFTTLVTYYEISGALMALFALAAAAFGVAALLALRGTGATVEAAAPLGPELPAAALSIAVVALIAFGLMQLVPVEHANPKTATPVAWDSPRTQELYMRACGSCHSNDTAWPWYSYIAPASWLNALDVAQGREQMNISALGSMQAFRRAQIPNDARQRLQNGSMPPPDYLLMHPEARLTADEKQQLIDGLRKTVTGQ